MPNISAGPPTSPWVGALACHENMAASSVSQFMLHASYLTAKVEKFWELGRKLWKVKVRSLVKSGESLLCKIKLELQRLMSHS